MTRHTTVIIMLVVLVIGFGAGFVLRPIIAPPAGMAVTSPRSAPAQPNEARGIQYFVAHVEEARRTVEGCRDGTVRGAECTNAEEAIIKVEAEERRRRFLGD